MVGAFLLGILIDRVEPVRVLAGPWNAVIGTAAFLGGTALFVGAVRQMRDANTSPSHGDEPPELITDGVFGYSRHPIYLGTALQTVGLSLVYDSAWSLAMLSPVVVYLDRGAAREEQYLETRFGDRVGNYRETVPRWL